MRKLKPANLIVLLACSILIGCEADPLASFSVSTTIVETGNSVTFTNKSVDADSYEWFFGDGSSSTELNPTHTYTSPGNYIVTLVAYSKSQRKMDDAYHAYIWVVNPTVLTFNVTLNGSPLNGCSVALFDSYTNWYNDQGCLAVANTNAQGKVSFTGCSNKIYYADFYHNDNYYGYIQTEELTLFTENTFNINLFERQITFNNPTYTPIDIQVSGFSQRTIPVGENTTYNVPSNSVTLSASATERFTNGNPMALTINWSSTIALTQSSTNINLNVGTDFIFLYFRNNAGYSLGPIYSNYGNSTYEVMVNASIPSDNQNYRIGYHHARYGNQIRAYYGSSYWYWTHNIHFTYPSVPNQALALVAGSKSNNFVEKDELYEKVLIQPSNILKVHEDFRLKFKDTKQTISLEPTGFTFNQ